MSITVNTAGKQDSASKHRAFEADDSKQSAVAADLRALHQVSTRMHFTRGETIFDDSDDATHAYRVVSGAVRLCKYTIDGRRQIIEFLQPGDFFGFFKLEEYGFTAEAVTEVTLLSYPRIQIERLEATTPGVQGHMNALLSEWLMTMQQHLVLLGCQTAKERVASFLLRMSDRSGLADGERLSVAMGRQDIADHLGLTIETVCRALSELKRDRLIGIPNVHEVVVNDMSALCELADGGPSEDQPRSHAPHIPNLRQGARPFARNGSLVS